jgi:hypothetical protein
MSSRRCVSPLPERVHLLIVGQLLRPEVERRVPWWSYLGALCGAGVGFIIANFPGLIAGLIAGNRLGAIRDAKGKSVAVVFTNLGGEQKAQVRLNMFSFSSVLTLFRSYAL